MSPTFQAHDSPVSFRTLSGRSSTQLELEYTERKMKLTWNKKGQSSNKRPFAAVSRYPNLPFEEKNDEATGADGVKDREGDFSLNRESGSKTLAPDENSISDPIKLAQSFQTQGDKLAEEGKYKEALGKWETAINLMPGNAVLQEQKAQVLLEIGDAWNALKAATRATDLEPSWAEGWVTLGRAQLNFGEPDSAVESFDRALSIKPDSEEAKDDRRAALNLVKRRKQLHLSGSNPKESRFVVNDKLENS